MTDAPDFPDIIADLRARIAQLPTISYENGDIMDQHRRHRKAANELGDYLTATYGARIAEKPEGNCITMRRISSTSTSGLHGAFSNWIAAAEKRLAQQPGK
ncbi:hypothetical protein [Paracoccus methylarcula]|uniref:Uncharacterized protein n=1 Tax=Paracoccus methylarcula TaxID=72022 RepID=A0A3R7M9T2_9RHOB|nr:hypothetical protein [Paracoccus methylarcula]RNF35060.1 hypothetical protein A7A09_008840 [Paracoccus methylarcula]